MLGFEPVVGLVFQFTFPLFPWQLFYIGISLSGMAWLVFFHVDLFRYKQQVLKNMEELNQQMDKASSTGNDFFIPEGTFGGGGDDTQAPPYSFLTGRHSGSFYLKTGLAGTRDFCTIPF